MLLNKNSVQSMLLQSAAKTAPVAQNPAVSKALVVQDAVSQAPNAIQQAVDASGGAKTVFQMTNSALEGQQVLSVQLALDNTGTTSSCAMVIFDGSGMVKYKSNINGTGQNPVSGAPLTGGGIPTISSTDWGSNVLTLFANFSNGNRLFVNDIKLINTSGNSIAAGLFQEWYVYPNGQISASTINFNVMRSAQDLTSGIQNVQRNALTSSTYGILATVQKNDVIQIVISYSFQSAGAIMS